MKLTERAKKLFVPLDREYLEETGRCRGYFGEWVIHWYLLPEGDLSYSIKENPDYDHTTPSVLTPPLCQVMYFLGLWISGTNRKCNKHGERGDFQFILNVLEKGC